MGKFEVKVTKRSEEWAEENAPLEDADPREAPGCRPTGPEALGCQTGCVVTPDTPGYGSGGPLSPLDD